MWKRGGLVQLAHVSKPHAPVDPSRQLSALTVLVAFLLPPAPGIAAGIAPEIE